MKVCMRFGYGGNFIMDPDVAMKFLQLFAENVIERQDTKYSGNGKPNIEFIRLLKPDDVTLSVFPSVDYMRLSTNREQLEGE